MSNCIHYIQAKSNLMDKQNTACMIIHNNPRNSCLCIPKILQLESQGSFVFMSCCNIASNMLYKESAQKEAYANLLYKLFKSTLYTISCFGAGFNKQCLMPSRKSHALIPAHLPILLQQGLSLHSMYNSDLCTIKFH